MILEDGWVLAEMEDGAFTDGDMTWDSERELKASIDYDEYEPGFPGFDEDRYEEVIRLAEKYY